MKHALLAVLLLAVTLAGAQDIKAGLDEVYHHYVTRDVAAAEQALRRLDAAAAKPADRFAVKLELADFLLDKQNDYPGAEAIYSQLIAEFPREKRLPDVIYRLALSQELQERFLDAAKNYEQVATRYMKSAYGEDALDAIERCFRKNYQDRVAYVNGFPITRIELDERIGRNPAAYEQYERKVGLLDTMIDNRLLYVAALEAGTLNDPQLARDLLQYRNRALFEAWYDQEVTAKAEPSDKELKAAYNKDRASRYTTEERVHGHQIVVADTKLAESLRAALLADTSLSWDSVAKEHSIAPDKERGGDMGLFARKVQPRAIENAAFALKPGQISKPVKTELGYTIIKVTDRKPKVVRTFDEVKNQIQVQLRQDRINELYERNTAALRAAAALELIPDAIVDNRDTLAVVNGQALTAAMLDERLEQIPVFYRSQFMSPEGKTRILDQLILEQLILRECEMRKLWLANKVVDRVLEQRARMAIDRYRARAVRDEVTIDPAEIQARYRATLAEHNVPAQVHAREIAAPTEARARQVRGWVRSGKLPVMLEGRALLVPNREAAFELRDAFAQAANTDSFVALYGLAGPAAMPGTPTARVGTKDVPTLTAKFSLAGPYRDVAAYGLAFTDLSAEDRLYLPELRTASTAEEQAALFGAQLAVDSSGAAVADPNRLGSYVALERTLPESFIRDLFRLETGEVITHELPFGTLLVKVTRRDSARSADFGDIARRFSSAASRWSGGDLNWLTRDDKARDKKLVETAFSTSAGTLSQTFKLGDGSWAFVKVEEKKAAYTRPLDEVKLKIEDDLRREREQEAATRLLALLRGAATIEVVMTEADFTFEPEPSPEE